MDYNSLLSSGVSGVILGIIYITYKMIKRSSCRSKCCGNISSFSLDLERGLTSVSSSDSNSTN